MPYLSRFKNNTVFQGELSPWARALAYCSLQVLVGKRSTGDFVATFPLDNKPCYIIPVIAPTCITVTALYGLRRGLRAVHLAGFEFNESKWRDVCRAYVRFTVTPDKGITGLGHDSTVRAALSIAKFKVFNRALDLAEIDHAIGTQLLSNRFNPVLIEARQ
jgi:hypothetical protein